MPHLRSPVLGAGFYKFRTAELAAFPKSFSTIRVSRFYFAKRNSCACIATVLLHNLNYVMRRDIFQAIADPTRRAIIALIAVQAMTPNALAEHFDTSRQAVSKHLRILTECELVTQEQKGREIYYSLEIEKMKEIDEWLEQYQKDLGNPI